ncbi:MAG: hypothetical protein NVS4B12_20830 [Ktedonobacteraceae bacterium]
MTPLFDWIREHRIASLVILVLLLISISGIWWVQPTYFAVTHTNMQDCGYVTRMGAPGLRTGGNSTPGQIIQCFVQANKQCRAASIASTVAGTDAGTTETFYTANTLGRCAFSVQTENYVISFRDSTTNYGCSSMIQKSDGLNFFCDSLGEQIFPVK